MMVKVDKTVKLVAAILTAALLSNTVFAKDLLSSNFVNNVKTEINEKMVQNLANGIASDNAGLKKSCIYFAGFYEIEGLVKPLLKQLKKEQDSNTRDINCPCSL